MCPWQYSIRLAAYVLIAGRPSILTCGDDFTADFSTLATSKDELSGFPLSLLGSWAFRDILDRHFSMLARENHLTDAQTDGMPASSHARSSMACCASGFFTTSRSSGTKAEQSLPGPCTGSRTNLAGLCGRKTHHGMERLDKTRRSGIHRRQNS